VIVATINTFLCPSDGLSNTAIFSEWIKGRTLRAAFAKSLFLVIARASFVSLSLKHSSLPRKIGPAVPITLGTACA
jgi:hypothetical protein